MVSGGGSSLWGSAMFLGLLSSGCRCVGFEDVHWWLLNLIHVLQIWFTATFGWSHSKSGSSFLFSGHGGMCSVGR